MNKSFGQIFRVANRLSFTVFILLVLAGCGSANPPARLSEIPVPPDLAIYEGAEEVTFDTLILALKRAFEIQPQKVDIQYYWMPETVNWKQVEQFYQTALADAGWIEDKEAATFNTTRWLRNSSADKQVLVVSAVPLASAEGHILLVILVSP